MTVPRYRRAASDRDAPRVEPARVEVTEKTPEKRLAVSITLTLTPTGRRRRDHPAAPVTAT